MEKKRKKVNIKQFLTRGLLCILVLYLCGRFVAQQFDLYRENKKEELLDQQIAEQERIHQELSKEYEAAGTPEYIEKVARDKLGFMKPDEKLFVDPKKQ